MGYLGRATVPARRQRTTSIERAAAAARANALLESLLDEQQRRDRRRTRRWWVQTDRGWLQMGGSPHDIRYRPSADPGTEWSLCVVTTDARLPRGDVWSSLLLSATVYPDEFFRVAHRRRVR